MKSLDDNQSIQASITGCLLGCALGDALGLPYEGLSARRAQKMLGFPEKFKLLGHYGMVSDDTEHSCLVAQSLLKYPNDPKKFQNHLAKKLKWWFLSLPAGMGLSTGRAIIKLCLGFPPKKSGVFSAGNGAAMRIAILGVCINDSNLLLNYVKCATELTHTDPKALYGAQLVALVSQYASHQSYQKTIVPNDLKQYLKNHLEHCDDALKKILAQLFASLEAQQDTQAFANDLGLHKGVTGYVYHTLPIALHAFLNHQGNPLKCIQACICCGGDTDTVAAIVGSLAGAHFGDTHLPHDMLKQIIDFPKNLNWIKHLSTQLTHKVTQDTQNIISNNYFLKSVPDSLLSPFLWILKLLRNILFLIIVLTHGIRRLLPPY